MDDNTPGVYGGGRPRAPQAQAPGYQGPGSQYGTPQDSGWTWNPGAGQQFSQNNQINPNTGMFYPGQEGGLVPANVALQYQALSDQGIWRSRQAMMRSGINYARGALGLLQSFRPGGGATIESGQYNQLAGLEFNRAQMTQPLDLLGDYRRHETAVARQQANRAQERQLAVQIAATAAGLAFGGVGALGSAAGMASTFMQQGAGSYNQSADTASQQHGQQVAQMGQNPMQGPQQPPSTFGPGLPQSGGGGGQAGGTFQAQSSAPGQQGAQPAQGGQQGQPGAQGQGAGGKSIQGQPGQAGGQAMGMPTVGSNGDFSPLAYAATGVGGLAHPIQQMALTRATAQMVEDDPFYATFSAAVNARWQQRLSA